MRLAAAMLWLGAIPIEAATIYVGERDSLQDALDAAQPGETILLAQGVEFVGTFVLPVKSGADWITVRSSTPDTMLPGLVCGSIRRTHRSWRGSARPCSIRLPCAPHPVRITGTSGTWSSERIQGGPAT
jgi:hypothetical protein